MNTKSNSPETIRGFWHGSPLSAYQVVSLRSVVAMGHRIELFTYDPGISVPDWVIRKDANEIWPRTGCWLISTIWVAEVLPFMPTCFAMP